MTEHAVTSLLNHIEHSSECCILQDQWLYNVVGSDIPPGEVINAFVQRLSQEKLTAVGDKLTMYALFSLHYYLFARVPELWQLPFSVQLKVLMLLRAYLNHIESHSRCSLYSALQSHPDNSDSGTLLVASELKRDIESWCPILPDNCVTPLTVSLSTKFH